MRTLPAPPDEATTEGEPADRRGPSGLAVVRIAVPVLVLAAAAVARPAILTGVLGSPRAMALVLGMVIATLGWSALLRRFVRGEVLLTVLVLLPVGVFMLAYLGPYFGDDQVVDEALPPAAGAAAAPIADPAADPTADQAADGQVPVADAGATGASAEDPAQDPADNTTADTGAGTPADAGSRTPQPVAPPPPAGPTELSRGTFIGLDDHFATGAAALYDLGGGERIVRLEDVDLQRVPDAHVYLVPGADATEPTADATYLGPLTGNVGSSNYALPADLVLDGPSTVLVWCEAFASPVGAATQS